MKAFFSRIDRFFFAPLDARGFGLMRIAWAVVAVIYFLFQWRNVTFYYTNQGALTPDVIHTVVRSVQRITLLDWIHDPHAVFALYLLLLLGFLCTAIGILPRAMVIVTTLLMFTFHEGNPLVLGGGDTLLRNIAFLLCLAPRVDAFSLQRALRNWKHWKHAHAPAAPSTISIWPYRLLLWQMICLYGTSFWYKVLGASWLQGTAVGISLMHPVFSRWPHGIWWLLPITGVTDYLSLLWEASWILLLLPKWFWELLLPKSWHDFSLKRFLMLWGLFFHGMILVLMDAGSFSLVIFTAYLGLLTAEDFVAIRIFWKPAKYPRIAVLYDGNCLLCMRSVYVLQLCDWLKLLQLVNFRDSAARIEVAPTLKLQDLDRALHIVTPHKTATGFDGLRFAARYLPPLWPVLPFIWIPGVAPIGRLIYGQIAKRREQCVNGDCIH